MILISNLEQSEDLGLNLTTPIFMRCTKKNFSAS